MALIGNTIRLEAFFLCWDGTPASPDNVVLRIYDMHRQQVGEDIPVDPVAVGQYQYDFEVPQSPPGHLFFEFSGMLEGNPIVGRSKISKVWVK